MYGLVIIDGDDSLLKNQFSSIVKDELLQGTSFKEVSKTNAILKNDYKIQVNPREINLFYLTDSLRERIICKDGQYVINNTQITFSENEIIDELNTHPERFSPNVIMRPLYQETILPNLCYIGGGGELAYWFQLKQNFKKLAIPFPILLLRNSALLISEKQSEKLNKLSLTNRELFMKQFELINYKVRQISNIPIDFSKQKEALETQFADLEILAEQTDRSFVNAVKAQKTKQIKGLDVLEKRLLKAQRIKLSDQVSRLTELHAQLFPQQSLQERKMNFSEFYLEYGEDLIVKLKEGLAPLSHRFDVLVL